MSGPIGLLKAFDKGYIRKILILTGEEKKPPTGKHWLVLGGAILHVTGTISKACLHYQGVVSTQPLRYVEAASTTGYYALFSTIADAGDNDDTQAVQAQYSFVVLDELVELCFDGGTNSKLLVEVIEW